MRIYQKYNLLGSSAMNSFTIDPGKTALVVVDMQYASIHPDHGFHKLYRDLGMAEEVRYAEERLEQLLIPNIRRLLAAFRAAGQRVIYLTVGSERDDYGDYCPRRLARIEFWRQHGIAIPYARVGDPGHAILPELAPQPGELVINKTTSSAFNSSTFDQTLRELGITTLVICGVGTNYCVEMTFRDASDRGYLCILAEDACGTSTPEMHEAGVLAMSFYGRIASSEGIVNELNAVLQETNPAR